MECVNERAPGDISVGIPGSIPYGIPGEAFNRVILQSLTESKGIPYRILKGIPGQITDAISWQINEIIPEDISQGICEKTEGILKASQKEYLPECRNEFRRI